MSRNNQPNGKAAEGRLKVVKLNCSSLIVLLTLCLSAVAVAVFVAGYSIFHWDTSLCDVGEAPPQQCTERHINPLLLQMQVLGDNDSSSREVVVAFEKDQWAYEIVEALRQIQQTLENNGSSAINVVVDPKENPWIDKLIHALRDAGKRQSCTPDAGANPVGGDNNKPECQARNYPDPSEGQHSTCDVVVNLEKPPWVDDLVNALHGILEFQAIDPAIRADVKEHLKCTGGERLSVSGLIRFQGGRYSLDGAAKDMIDAFTCQVGNSATKWGVFGFASESGSKEMNRTLSWQRACEVKKHICEDDDFPLCKADRESYLGNQDGQTASSYKCVSAEESQDMNLPIYFLGEDHFINGVADSRSVIIAACRKQD